MGSELHVIFGTGAVGCWTARALRTEGKAVRAVNRSGERPLLMPEDVEIIKADATNEGQAIEAASGAAVVVQAMNPPYHQWHRFFPALQAGAMSAARAAGAVLVSIENLYMYDSSAPIREDSPIRPKSKKGALRQRMSEDVMAAHARGEVRVVALRSSDYYGPGVLGSALGEMVFGNLVKGKNALVNGSAEMPHSSAYIEDVGRAASMLGTREEALGRVWIAPHVPAKTQGQMVELACRSLGIKSRLTVVSPMMMRLVGLFVPPARESVEMMYEFTAPFVVDSSRFEGTFGMTATPIETGIERTVGWYQEQYGKG